MPSNITLNANETLDVKIDQIIADLYCENGAVADLEMISGDLDAIRESYRVFGASVLALLADKLQSESMNCVLAINFGGYGWQIGDMYGYGVADREGGDIESLMKYIQEPSSEESI